MSEWNAMTYEGKDTILRVVRNEAEQFFALAERPEVWDAPTACADWSTRDLVAHIVDTTEGYFRAFDAARGSGEVPDPHGLPLMSQKANEGATALRGVPQDELMERLRNDFDKMQQILEPLGPDEWTGFMVTHPYMGPVPAFFYAAGQLMDYGVHSWDIRETSGNAHGLSGDVGWSHPKPHAGKTVVSPGVASKLASRLREDELTARELEILTLVGQGLSNKLIARALDITEGTVKTHVKNVLEKLDATSRTEALAVAARRGLITL